MPKSERQHTPTYLRIGVLIPLLAVLLFGLYGVGRLFERSTDVPNSDKRPIARPKRHVAEATQPAETKLKVETQVSHSYAAPSSKVAPAPPLLTNQNKTNATQPALVAASQPAARNSSTLSSSVAGRNFQGAILTGKAILRGRPPANPVIDLRANPDCGKVHTNRIVSPFYVVGEDGALADVVVYLKFNGRRFNAPKSPVVIDQVGCMYSPYVVALQTGQTLVVKNSDALLHNVHPTPAAAGNRESNTAEFPGKELTLRFESPEMFLRIKCDVHPWMFAYACVMPNPYYAITGKDGQFVIEDVPVGHYVLEAAHRKLGVYRQEFDIRNRKEVIAIDIQFDVDHPPQVQQQAKAGP